MALLTSDDKLTYFPTVSQTDTALTGLMTLAQALCESSYGANRSLELQEIKEIVSVNPMYGVAVLSHYPIASLVVVEALTGNSVGGSFGRIALGDWAVLPDSYRLDAETGELWLSDRTDKIRATYTAGYNFTGTTPDIQKIKAIAGQVLTYFANYKVGLDSYLNNPSGDQGVESYNLVRPDQYLAALLLPLRKYMARRSFG